MIRTGVIDYGSGNFRSVWNALDHLGVDLFRVTTPSEFQGVSRLILPGVGSFGACMRRLHELGLVGPLKSWARDERPLLGICVGLQVLGDVGEEHGEHTGLGLVPGRVRRIETAGSSARLPHVGWNVCSVVRDSAVLRRGEHPEFYFVHSYHLDAEDPEHVVATCQHGETVTTVVERGSLVGVQFHPEKSQRDGLEVLARFCGTEVDHAA